MRNPLNKTKLATVALALTTAALALGTPAGTNIENIATLQYVDEDGSTNEVPSPPVNTVVMAVCSPSVLPNGSVGAPGQTATLMPGSGTVFHYSLTNTGNATNTFSLSTITEAASQFTPSDLAVFQDSNGNGQIDAGEAQISQVTLAADATTQLLVRAGTANSSRGNAYVNLVAACTTNTMGNSNERDADNVSRLNLTDPPAFTVNKTFTPTNPKPGALTTVSISSGNTGGPSKEVTVSDFLNTSEMRDFVFQSGSAKITGTATGGVIEYSADGSTWTSTEPTGVIAVRVRAPSLPTGTTLGLTFDLRAPEADLGTRRNIAQLSSTGQTIEAPADVTVKYYPVIALGPQGNPEANPGGEMSADDRQTKDVALVNQQICFVHTVKNLGERDDTISTTGAVSTGAATIQFKDMNGTPIDGAFKVTLAPGATADFQACYVPTQTGGPNEALKVTLTSTSERGATNNSTVDVVNTVAENKLHPLKTGDKGSNLVGPGDLITYTLTFTNAQSFALKNVVISDPLNIIERTCLAPSSLPGSGVSAQSLGSGSVGNSTTTSAGNLVTQSTTTPSSSAQAVYSAMTFVSADQGGVVEGNNVVWRFPTIQAGQTVTMTLQLRVPQDVPDCANITNVYNVTSDEIGTPIPSDPVTNTVFDPEDLRFSKTSTPSTVVLGEQITYILRVTNGSSATVLNNVQVTDVLPTGLEYVEGSSTLDGAAITPTIDPANPRKYVWTVPGLAVGGTAEVRFRATVTPDAPEQLTNNAVATAVASGRITTSPTSVASNKILPLSFGVNNADIVGYVFQDVNRNGIYDYGKDIPQQNARVILANARIELTDKEGRYHFRNVREGNWALRLDPNSVWQQNMSMPQDAGRPGSRSLYVRNLTSVDFPLVPDAGDIAVLRDTTLTIKGGPVDAQNSLVVRKQVFQATKDPTLYTVQLTLNASASLNALTLTDPLPEGATLVSGQNTLTIDPLPSGERTLNYSFRFTRDEKAAVTDPTASWRY